MRGIKPGTCEKDYGFIRKGWGSIHGWPPIRLYGGTDGAIGGTHGVNGHIYEETGI